MLRRMHVLRRTSVFKHAWWEGGARGWNRDPIVLRCEACARKGVDGETVGGAGREGGRRVDLHTRHEPLSQRDGTDWKPFIHSVALYFFPVFDWESIVDHPSSPLSSSTLSLSRSVPTGTLNYYFSPFSFFLSSLFSQPFKSSNSGCR